MKDKIEYYKLEHKIQSSHECLVSKLKSSNKVMKLLDSRSTKKKKSSSFLVQAAPFAGTKKMIKVVKSHRKPLSTGKILKRDQNGNYSFIETASNTIWGYLAKNEVLFPLEKRMDNRLEDETAGYTIGSHPNSDIQLRNKNNRKIEQDTYF